MANHQISITENGTTTLATAGKYCDRNIDVVTNVPTYETELEEQKAITESIISKTITEYANDTLTFIHSYGFYFCESLHTLNCPNVTNIGRYGVGYCTALQRVSFPNLTVIYGYAFGSSSSLNTLILGYSRVCELKGTNAFASTPIANGTGYIYVPDNLVDSYKTATNWSTFAGQIKPISELEE